MTQVPPLPVPTPLVDVSLTTASSVDSPLAVVVGTGAAGAGPRPGPGAVELGVDQDWLDAAGITGSVGQPTLVPRPARANGVTHGWVVGIGDGEPVDWRAAGAELVRAANARAARDVEADRNAVDTLQLALPADLDPDRLIELVLGLALGGYAFRITGHEQPPRVRQVDLLVTDDAPVELSGAVRYAMELAAATSVARDLANTPSDRKDPAWLATTAARLAADIPGLLAEVHDEHWLAERGFGGVLAVGGGSARPPRLLELRWQPAADSDSVDDGSAADDPQADGLAHLVLVGKGITFDTGGISIKPADGMHLMRTDMAGGAAVIGAMLRIAAMRLPVRVTALVPCAENHVSGSAYRPGDVVTHFGGTTTEVTNTDAEGRLVLADALAYAVQEYEPDLLIDVATLTGAMKVSLGLRTGGLFSNTDDLAAQLAEAGSRVGESWWRMPLLDAHAEAVRSELADVRQCPPGPGGIGAALFLREFTGGLPWAHLDIAGPARAEAPYHEVTPIATGFAARTLVEFVQAYE